MKNIDELIYKLANNNEDANKICKKLIDSKNYDTLISLNNLKIYGDYIVKLYDTCGYENQLELLIATVEFLSSGYIDKTTMLENLHSDHTIPFLPHIVKKDEYLYYTNLFYKNSRISKDKNIKDKKSTRRK